MILRCDTVTSEHLNIKPDPGKQLTSHTENNKYVYIVMEIRHKSKIRKSDENSYSVVVMNAASMSLWGVCACVCVCTRVFCFAFPDCSIVTTSFVYYILLKRSWLGSWEEVKFINKHKETLAWDFSGWRDRCFLCSKERKVINGILTKVPWENCKKRLCSSLHPKEHIPVGNHTCKNENGSFFPWTCQIIAKFIITHIWHHSWTI